MSVQHGMFLLAPLVSLRLCLPGLRTEINLSKCKTDFLKLYFPSEIFLLQSCTHTCLFAHVHPRLLSAQLVYKPLNLYVWRKIERLFISIPNYFLLKSNRTFDRTDYFLTKVMREWQALIGSMQYSNKFSGKKEMWF